MPNGAIRHEEWLCTCGKRNFMQKAFCRECGEQPTKTQKQHGAGGNAKDGGASPRQAPPKSPTPSSSGETTKTTNNDTQRKITLQEEAAKTAREFGDEDMLQAIEKKLTARRKGGTRRCTTNRCPTGQCNSVSRQEKCRAGNTTRTSGTRTGKAQQLASRSNGSGQVSNNVEGRSTHGRPHTRKTETFSTRLLRENCQGSGSREGVIERREKRSPRANRIRAVRSNQTIRGREGGCANGQCGPKHPNGVLGGRRKALDKSGTHATKRSSVPRNLGQQKETQQLNNCENATPAEQMMEWRRTIKKEAGNHTKRATQGVLVRNA